MTTVGSLERLAELSSAAASTPRKRMLVVVNPYATTVSDRLRNLVVYALQGRYDVEAIDTKARDHATALAREAAQEGYDVVVAFGGDGTLNEVANGLAGSPTPLTCLPGGSTNVFCRMLGIPNDIVDATEHLLALADDFRPRSVDLASVNGRAFTFSAGYGLDASVVERVDRHPKLKSRLGPYYFAWAGFSIFNRRYVVNPPRMEAVLPDGTRLAGVTALVQNSDPYTYFKGREIYVAEDVSLESGTLAGCVLRRSTPTLMPSIIFRLLSSRARVAGSRGVDGFSGVPEVVIRSLDDRPIDLQVDGDYIGAPTEARFSLDPRRLRVLS
jgi:diacylglycerol kinase family enzyme